MATKKDKAIAVREAVDMVLDQMRNLQVKSDEEYQVAAGFLVRVKTVLKMVDEQFSPDIDKAKIILDAIKKEKQKLVLPLQQAETAAKHLISGYMRRAREEAERQAVKDAKKSSANPGFVVVAPKDPVPKAEGVTGVDHWGFEVTDPVKVPREYLCVDTQKIGAVVRAMKGQVDIPGVKVIHDVVVRAGTL